ncbi:TOX high mobility group box family member 3 isoform X5 [Macaca fascicularis]|uniref:TOX high mobility group box family member 3 isoform X5 n=1 Tax=Macaca fascicularis TaxID=9541 RepID=UPI003D1559C1
MGPAGRGGRARRRSGPRSAPAGRAARQLPAVGGAERRRRGEGTGGGGRRGRRRGGAGPLVSAARLLSPPGEEEEERGQPPPPPPSQPRPAHLNSPRRPGPPRRAPRPRRPARAQRCLGAPAGRVPRAASRSPAARVAAPLCAAAAAPGLLGLRSRRPSDRESRAPPPGAPDGGSSGGEEAGPGPGEPQSRPPAPGQAPAWMLGSTPRRPGTLPAWTSRSAWGTTATARLYSSSGKLSSSSSKLHSHSSAFSRGRDAFLLVSATFLDRVLLDRLGSHAQAHSHVGMPVGKLDTGIFLEATRAKSMELSFFGGKTVLMSQ